MYVIRWQNLGSNVLEHTGPGAVRYFPADRCTFEIAPTGDPQQRTGYEISQVIFYSGSPVNSTVTGGTTNYVQGTQLPVGTGAGRATYGYIGKSGRFVGLSQENT